MTQNRMLNDYFEWLYDLVCGERFSRGISFRKLLVQLYNTDFIYIHPRDINRAKDGADLRYRFALIQGLDDVPPYLDGYPCSVLEMMVALAIRCEETIMDDPQIGDRTSQWFWGMVNNLGLGAMFDDVYDSDTVDYILNRFLYREYEPDGRGGLFTIRGCEYDLRKAEIWHQLNWYLNNIT